MPRFDDACVPLLKTVMLQRVPECIFLPEDVDLIAGQIGLNAAQIRRWEKNFRVRYTTFEEREKYLCDDKDEVKDKTSSKVNRYYINCFNVDPAFAEGFKFPKSKGGGNFTITYMECAFNKEEEWGEMFIEFEEKVWEHKLEKCLVRAGAASVTIQTFAHNDGGQSAVNSLVRIHNQCTKNGWTPFTRGVCPPALQTKVLEKRAAESVTAVKEEFDAKTKEAINRSLALQEDIMTNVNTVNTNVEHIKDGVCAVIPDYQRRIEELERILAHKTKECDRIEYAKAQQTRKVNELTVALKMAVDDLNTSNSALAKLKLELESKNDMWTRIIKIDDMMSDFISEVRSSKRSRGE